MHEQQPPDKQLVWVKSSYTNLCSFHEDARQEAGFQLRKVQQGKLPEDWKPMPSVGPGAIEIRIHYPHQHRVIYVAIFHEAIYVLHAFEKKTQKTSLNDLNNARKAYAEIKANRQKTK